MMYVIEGPDYAGKTTLLQKIKKKLEAQITSPSVNEDEDAVVVVKFPGQTEIGLSIRNLLLHGQKEMTVPFSSAAQARLMCADMDLTTHTIIRPRSEKGLVTLCDRYYLSTLVYQFLSKPENERPSPEEIKDYFLPGGIFNGLMRPKRTFIINASPEVIKERMKDRTQDFFENGAWRMRMEIYKNIYQKVGITPMQLMNAVYCTKENNTEEDGEELAEFITGIISQDITAKENRTMEKR